MDFRNIGQIINPTAYNRISGASEAQYQQNFLNQQMEFNRVEAEKNREFQREMSNTAFQRMAEDLKKAGFNPALLLNGGGASTPTGSLATSSLASAPAVTSSYTAYTGTKFKSYTDILNNLITNAFNAMNTDTKTKGSFVSSIIGALLG